MNSVPYFKKGFKMKSKYINELLVKYLGLKITRSRPTFEQARKHLIESCDVSFVVDGGANRGQWAVEILKEYPNLDVLSIEPIREAFLELESQTARFANWRSLNVALGDAVGTGVMHVANNDEQSSSLLEPEFHLEHYPTVQFTRTQETRITTLDSLQIDENEKVYLKLDIQGHELAALIGGSNLLTKVVAIELEMSPIEMYSSQATFLDVANFLDKSGFKIFTFADIFRDNDGKWTYVDVIFSR